MAAGFESCDQDKILKSSGCRRWNYMSTGHNHTVMKIWESPLKISQTYMEISSSQWRAMCYVTHHTILLLVISPMAESVFKLGRNT